MANFNRVIYVDRDTAVGDSRDCWQLINSRQFGEEFRYYYAAPEPFRGIIVCRHGMQLHRLVGKKVVACLHPSLDQGMKEFSRFPGHPQRKLTLFRRGHGTAHLRLSEFLTGCPMESLLISDTIHSLERRTKESIDGVQSTTRVVRKREVIVRDQSLVTLLKGLHNSRCQLCGIAIELFGGALYAEVHHLRPLGSPHNGPDTLGNMICVCPNHHVQLDRGAIQINNDSLLRHTKHSVDPQYVVYHNDNVYAGSAKN